MKKYNIGRLSLGMVCLVAQTFALGAVQGPPGSGMLGTSHDFTVEGQHSTLSGMQIGLCSICHTPHSAISTQLLWNQKLTTATYTWGDATTTVGGTTLPNSAKLGPSTKCLSCHDGTVAVGETANYKGSVNGGAVMVGGYPLPGTLIMRMGAGGNGIGHDGKMTGNHPIAVPYPLNGAAGTYNGINTGSKVLLDEFVANPHSPANGIKLYNDDGNGKISGGTSAGKTGIECTSCHDPHNKAAVDDLFLRGKMAGSTRADGYICLQCHIK